MNEGRSEQRNDDELVEEIIRGSHSAFQELFYRYFKPLVRFAWFKIHSTETSRDLVQELFFRVWVNRQNLDSRKSIKAYLYKSLTNQIINHLKLSSSRADSLDGFESKVKINGSDEIEFEIDLATALESLPEKVKNVYILSRVEGYKYSEIAEICEVSVKAVEKRMSQAFALLKKLLSG